MIVEVTTQQAATMNQGLLVKPRRNTVSVLPAPIFWAVKVETARPRFIIGIIRYGINPAGRGIGGHRSRYRMKLTSPWTAIIPSETMVCFESRLECPA